MTREKLLHAQKTTIALFEAVEVNNLLVPGKTESQLVEEILLMAKEKFGIHEHWHKKIVRTGANTLATYGENPRNRVIAKGDILFLDFGPIVNGYEADLGRTYVLGRDPLKLKLKKEVEEAWYEIQAWIKKQTSVKASDLYHLVTAKATGFGWTFIGEIAGHIIGKYPHEQPADPKSPELDIHPDNHNDIFLKDADGNDRHWVLELQFADKENKIAAYFEQLL